MTEMERGTLNVPPVGDTTRTDGQSIDGQSISQLREGAQQRRFVRSSEQTTAGVHAAVPTATISESGTPAGEDDRSLKELVGDVTRHAQSLFRGEIELAKAELRDDVKNAAQGAALGGAAAVVGLVALILLGHFVAIALAAFLPNWVAYGIATLLFAAIAAGLGLAAKKRIQQVNPVPQDAIASAKEDVKWVKNHR